MDEKDIAVVECDEKEEDDSDHVVESNRVLFVAQLLCPSNGRNVKENLCHYFSKFGKVRDVFVSTRNGPNKNIDHALRIDCDNPIAPEPIEPMQRRCRRESPIPSFAFVEMETLHEAKLAMKEYLQYSMQQQQQNHQSRLFGYLAFATRIRQQKSQRHIEISLIRNNRLTLLEVWARATRNNGTGVVLEIHKSHEQRLHVWLEGLRTSQGNMAVTVSGSINISKWTTLLLLNTSLPDPSVLLQDVQSTWYVAPNIHRVTVVDKDSESIIKGSIRHNLVPAILQKVRMVAKHTLNTTALIKVRLTVFPIKMQMPLLRLLWHELDAQQKDRPAIFDFSHENASHSLSVLRVYGDDRRKTDELDDDDEIFVIGRLLSVQTAPIADSREASKASNAVRIERSVDNDSSEEQLNHDDWKIGLYYLYVDLTPLQIQQHIDLQQRLCERLHLNGRVRVSYEGTSWRKKCRRRKLLCDTVAFLLSSHGTHTFCFTYLYYFSTSKRLQWRFEWHS
jgi:hypothetical protein